MHVIYMFEIGVPNACVAVQEYLKESFQLIIIHYLLDHAVDWVTIFKGAEL